MLSSCMVISHICLHEIHGYLCHYQVANTVPECATVWCSAKAEYTQYPYGSRQDCWAIVSVKALRITTRHHVDIVAVIDNSGSMAGMKIQLVKETLLRLINLCELYVKIKHCFIKHS